MKKIIALLLLALIGMLLVACNDNDIFPYEKYNKLIFYMEAGNYERAYDEFLNLCENSSFESDTTKNALETDNIHAPENEELLLIESEDFGLIGINEKRFPDLIERIELTPENWKDYLKMYSFDEENVQKDLFGDVVGIDKYTYYVFGAGNEKYHRFENVVIELKNKSTDEIKSFPIGGFGYEAHITLNGETSHSTDFFKDLLSNNYDLNLYECTRITGYIYFIDIPEEALHSSILGYDLGFLVVNREYGGSEPFWIHTSTKTVNSYSKLSKYFE